MHVQVDMSSTTRAPILLLPALVAVLWLIGSPEPGAAKPAWVEVGTILGHAAIPLTAFARAPVNPWPHLRAGLLAMLACDWAAVLYALFRPHPPEMECEWCAVSLFGLLLFTPAYALGSALLTWLCGWVRRRLAHA